MRTSSVLVGVLIVTTARVSAAADYYVDATAGDDGSDGLSANTAWRSLDRVNAADLQPGDRVLFERGEIFRGQLRPKSGADGAPIVYGAYGAGPKPVLQGSVARNEPSSWTNEGGNIWVTPGPFAATIGNLIFDGGACGWLKLTSDELEQQGDFWNDGGDGSLALYSSANPTSVYGEIELALNRHIINNGNVSWVTYEGLHLRYGAAHGIGGSDSHHVTVRGCDISFIGGGLLTPTVRFGNGIEFWEDTSDNLVEGNRIWEIYDAALTNQGAGQSSQTRLVYRNNVVWNAEYCFEVWQRPESSVIEDIIFENNTCVRSGYGWGHEQRPDPNGWHLIFWGMDATPERFFVRNNLFYDARLCAFNPWDADSSWLGGDELDYNVYHQPDGHVMCAPGGPAYTQSEFSSYQSETGRDLHSLVGDPLFVDGTGADFHLTEGSPAIDHGIDTAVSTDFDGTPRPQGSAWDIGAYEYQAPGPDAGAGGTAGGGTGGGANGGAGASAAGGSAGGGEPLGGAPPGASDESSSCGCSAVGRRGGARSTWPLFASLGLAIVARGAARRRGRHDDARGADRSGV